MTITYTKQGDYNLPELRLSEQPQVELGVYAHLRRRFLKSSHNIRNAARESVCNELI